MNTTPFEDRYVTNRDLAKEMRSFRWEVRFLIAAAGIANMGLMAGLQPVVRSAGQLLWPLKSILLWPF